MSGPEAATARAESGSPIRVFWVYRSFIWRSALHDLRADMVQVTWFDPNTNGWVAVADKPGGSENAVPRDGIVRVMVVDYPHRMVTGNFFAWLPGYQNGFMKLSSRLAMRRE